MQRQTLDARTPPPIEKDVSRSETDVRWGLYRNYLLAQAHVDAPSLANAITHLNTSTTFSPLRPLQDTDIASYLRHAHEQNIISTIEEARRETQEDFYRVLEDRSRRDWEARKKRVFEELGGRVGGDNAAVAQYRKSQSGRNPFAVCFSRHCFLVLSVYFECIAIVHASRLLSNSQVSILVCWLVIADHSFCLSWLQTILIRCM